MKTERKEKNRWNWFRVGRSVLCMMSRVEQIILIILSQWTRGWRTVFKMRLKPRNEYDEYDSARRLWLNMTFALPTVSAASLLRIYVRSYAVRRTSFAFSNAQEETTEFIWIYFLSISVSQHVHSSLPDPISIFIKWIFFSYFDGENV